jgi:hypothetical protein
VGGTIAVQEILVRLTVKQGSISYSFYSRTNASGVYSIPWTIPGTGTDPRLSVIAERPHIASTTVVTVKPSPQFQIGASSQIVLSTIPIQPPFTGQVTVNFNLSSSDHLHAYLTAREVYAMYTAMDATSPPVVGDTIRSDMLGLAIDPMVVLGGMSGGGGVTLTDVLVQLLPATATDFPFVVAHEMGHALAWRSLGLSLAVIGSTDYFLSDGSFSGCETGGTAWSDFSCEVEKVEFHEGFAYLNEALWMWRRNADPSCNQTTNPRIPGSSGSFDLERAGICGLSSILAHKRPVCATRALWDIMDNPPSDGDGITNRDLSSVVAVLRSYPRNCTCLSDNGCNTEGDWLICPSDPDGNNWRDFRRNWEALFPGTTSLNSIEDTNGLDSQTNN